MRPRKKKNAEKRLEAVSHLLIKDISEFEKYKDIELEIGCGKGDFITAMALKNPDREYIAVEKVQTVIITALEKAERARLKNAKFLNMDVARLADIENSHFCSRIYLNFSDPWPHKRHEKRRLSADGFIELYKKLLADGGEIHMKTDNEQLFDFSLESFEKNGFGLKNVTRDLHADVPADNIMTEYEKNFVAQGLPIFRLEAF